MEINESIRKKNKDNEQEKTEEKSEEKIIEKPDEKPISNEGKEINNEPQKEEQNNEIAEKENIGFYSPVRIFFVQKENALKFEELKNLLVEDELNFEESYCNQLVKIHNKIEYKIK